VGAGAISDPAYSHIHTLKKLEALSRIYGELFISIKWIYLGSTKGIINKEFRIG
jgi:hypothetical protein